MGQYSRPEFEYLKDSEWAMTEKIDGTNIRVQFDDRGVSFKGKTNAAHMFPGMYECLTELFGTSKKVKKLHGCFKIPCAGPMPDKICLYGEGYGAGIQKGGCYRPDKGFVLFDIWVNGWWLQRKDVEDIAEKLKVDIVPVIKIGTLQDMVDLVSVGFNSQWGKFPAEGVVARPVCELQARNGQRIIVKLKHSDFH